MTSYWIDWNLLLGAWMLVIGDGRGVRLRLIETSAGACDIEEACRCAVRQFSLPILASDFEITRKGERWIEAHADAIDRQSCLIV